MYESDLITPKIRALAEETEAALAARFAAFDAVARDNTERVLTAFREHHISDSQFGGTSGYGYDDPGREALEKVYAQVFGAEAALVRLMFVNGTHAITAALFACLRPGDTLLAATGAPYDTLRGVIGTSGEVFGSLKMYGVDYAQVELAADGGPDFAAIAAAVREKKPACVLVQRSRGYAKRRALSPAEIGEIAAVVKEAGPDTAVVVDNCYGEFCDRTEPCHHGVDLMAGSLIKNPGGGLAPTGGYIAGRAELVERAAYRMTAPGIGGECGATLGQNRLLIQGFFLAPHTVAQALKTAALCAGMLEKLGCGTSPASDAARQDIIQMVELSSAERLVAFCQGIQKGSPVDAFVRPEPWRMPGYDCEVVMAAGAFVQGSSIELSCDGPLREPYLAYLQGGLTYEAGRFGVMAALSEMLDK